eukprot:5447152-Pyramimonas_sp.AAC.1
MTLLCSLRRTTSCILGPDVEEKITSILIFLVVQFLLTHNSLSHPETCRQSGPGASPANSPPLTIENLDYAATLRIDGGSFSHVDLANAPRTVVLKDCQSFTDGGRMVFKMWHSFQYRSS